MPSGTRFPFASRPFHRTRTFPRGNKPRATVTSLAPTRTAIVSRSARRSEKSIFAAAESQRQTGEKTLSMRVWEMGLGSSLRRCVTAKAVAVATSSSRARIVGAFLFIGARLYAAHTGSQPDDESNQPDAEPDGDHVAGGRHVQELHAAECEHAGKTEPQRVLRDVQREPARDPDSRNRADQEPRHRVEVDIALHEVAEAGDPEQCGCVEDVRPDDPRDSEGIDHHHHETEEGATADGGEPDDEAEHGADQHRADLVLALQDESRLARLHTSLDEGLGHESGR